MLGCAYEPRNEEQMPDRQTDASVEEDKQHEENRTFDVHIGKGGSETANEEQFLQIHRLASGERHDRPEPVFVQNSGHVDDDI